MDSTSARSMCSRSKRDVQGLLTDIVDPSTSDQIRQTCLLLLKKQLTSSETIEKFANDAETGLVTDSKRPDLKLRSIKCGQQTTPFQTLLEFANAALKEASSSGATVESNESQLVSCREGLSIVANCCNVSPCAAVQCCRSEILQNSVRVLCAQTCLTALKPTVLRLVGNLCVHNETAYSVVQLVQMLAALPHQFFAKRLLDESVALFVGELLGDSDAIEPAARSYCIPLLLSLARFCPKLCGSQLARSGCVETFMNICFNEEVARPWTNQVKYIRLRHDLLLPLCRHSFEVRSAVVGLGLIELLLTLARERSTTDGDIVVKLLTTLTQDAFARARLRESGALTYLLDEFASCVDESMDYASSERAVTILQSFKDLIYDQEGYTTMLEHASFLPTITAYLHRYCDLVGVTCAGGTPTGGSNATEFRPDSPSYVEIVASTSANQPADALDDRPLCRDFTADASRLQWEGGGRCASPSSWRGDSPRWSPNGSSLGSPDRRSTDTDMEPPAACSTSPQPRELPSKLCWSPTSRTSQQSAFSFTFRPNVPLSDTDSVGASVVDGEKKDNATVRAAQYALSMVSVLSHNTGTLGYIASHPPLIDALLRTANETDGGGVEKICRIVKRLARDRQLMEALIDADLHRRIAVRLCRVCACVVGPRRAPSSSCSRCRRSWWLGVQLLADFSTTVDSDFGFGVLEHRLASKQLNNHDKLRYMCAGAFLIRRPKHLRRLVDAYGLLDCLIGAIEGSSSCVESDDASLLTALQTPTTALTALTPVYSQRFVDALYADPAADLHHVSSISTAHQDLQQLFFTSLRAANVTPPMDPAENADVGCKLEALNVDISNQIRFDFEPLDGEDSTSVILSRNQLMHNSDYFKGMLSGDFCDASQSVFSDSADSENGRHLLIVLHFLHGCRWRCKQVHRCWLDPNVCFSVVQLADRYLCMELLDFLLPAFERSLHDEACCLAAALRCCSLTQSDGRFWTAALAVAFGAAANGDLCMAIVALERRHLGAYFTDAVRAFFGRLLEAN